VPLRSVPSLSFRLGLLLNEVPVIGFYWLLFDTALAFAQGDINAAGGWATVGLAAVITAGLAAITRRQLQARPALERAMAEALGPGWRSAIDPELAAPLRRRLPLAGRCRQLPELLGQHIQGDGALVLGVLVHDQLGELLSGLATRQIRHPYLLDCHRWPPRSNSGTA
jgi:hypothetical protein